MNKESKIYYPYQEAKSYEETREFIEWYRQSVRRSFDRHTVMLSHIPMHSYVLDYGCGWGIFSEMMHNERQCCVDGVDPDAFSIEIARDFIGKREDLSFSTTQIQDIPSEKYEVVVSAEVIEHTHNPGIYLRECNRVLRPGGFLIISLPNIMTPRYILTTMADLRKNFKSISRSMKISYDKKHHHIQAWDPATFCRLTCTMGFEYITHEFMEGWALPKTRYWRNPWGRLKGLSCKIVFKFKKRRFVDITSYE